MKKGVIVSLALASLLLVGCDSKEAGQNAAAKEQTAAKSTKQAATTQPAQQKTEDAKKEAAGETGAKAAKEEVKSVAKKAQEAKAAANEKADEAKAAAKSAKEEAAAAATTATAAAAAATSETESAAANIDAAKLFATKCASCHGPKGERKALGKSAPIGGMAKDEVLEKLKGYKAGTLNLYGMGALMKTQVASLSDAELEALAAYISTLK
jgi:cytochrome c553